MSPQEMLDYAIGALDDSEQEALERELRANPVQAERLVRLQRHLRLLLDDGDGAEPPPDLIARTRRYVALYRSRRTLHDFVPVSVPFRWADVGVAAGIFLAGLITLLPAVQRSRVQTNQAVCSFNLRQLGVGLFNYSAIHGTYPYPARNCPVPYAGLFQVMLHDSGLLRDLSALDCPCNGHSERTQPLPDYATLCALHQHDREHARHALCGDYAYNIGWSRGTTHSSPAPMATPIAIPLLADRPGHDHEGHIFPGNSPNHGGLGQNVLFTDGHVSWHTTRQVVPHDRDLFLNNKGLAQPGLDASDAVLAPGCLPVFSAP
jgi:prepilin-type processing-associated H-X9-DG protein